MILKKTFLTKNILNKIDLDKTIDVFNKTVFCFLSKENPIYQLISPPQYNESVMFILNTINSNNLKFCESTVSSEILSESVMNSKWKSEIEIWLEFLKEKYGNHIKLSNVIANIIELENIKESCDAD